MKGQCLDGNAEMCPLLLTPAPCAMGARHAGVGDRKTIPGPGGGYWVSGIRKIIPDARYLLRPSGRPEQFGKSLFAIKKLWSDTGNSGSMVLGGLILEKKDYPKRVGIAQYGIGVYFLDLG